MSKKHSKKSVESENSSEREVVAISAADVGEIPSEMPVAEVAVAEQVNISEAPVQAEELEHAAVSLSDPPIDEATVMATLPAQAPEQSILEQPTPAAEVVTAAPATVTAPTPKPLQKFVRRVYGEHRIYGTCITLGARVYLAPEGAKFDKKSVTRLAFARDGEGNVFDSEGREWICGGENGGCGQRCPAALKDEFGKNWHSMSFRERTELIKARTAVTVPSAAAAK